MLKYLYLDSFQSTGTLTDVGVDIITQYCPKLRMLDIAGHNSVTISALERLLTVCQNMVDLRLNHESRDFGVCIQRLLRICPILSVIRYGNHNLSNREQELASLKVAFQERPLLIVVHDLLGLLEPVVVAETSIRRKAFTKCVTGNVEKRRVCCFSSEEYPDKLLQAIKCFI